MKTRRLFQLGMIAVLLAFALPSHAQIDAAADGFFVADHIYHTNSLESGALKIDHDIRPIAANLVVRSGEFQHLGDIEVDSLFSHMKLTGFTVASFAPTLIGRFENESTHGVVLNFYTETDQKRFVGTLFLPAGSEMDTTVSERLSKKLLDQLAYGYYEQEMETVGLYVKVMTRGAGSEGAQVRVHKIALRTAPMHHAVFQINNNPHRTYPARAAVSKVHLSGSVTNRGDAPMRVLLVVGMEGMFGMDYTEGIVADGYVAPKETMEVNSLMVEGGDTRLRVAMSEAVFGDPIEVHMLVFSEASMKGKVESLELKTEVSFR